MDEFEFESDPIADYRFAALDHLKNAILPNYYSDIFNNCRLQGLSLYPRFLNLFLITVSCSEVPAFEYAYGNFGRSFFQQQMQGFDSLGLALYNPIYSMYQLEFMQYSSKT